MFDIAFSELVAILVVALVVIGPERLPKVARTAGHMWGRMQRYVHSVKNDIANDLAIEEARQLGGNIRKEISSAEQSLLDARMELEQKIMQAQMGETPAASSDNPANDRDQITSPSSTPTSKPNGNP